MGRVETIVSVSTDGEVHEFKTCIPVGLIRCGETDGSTFREFVDETWKFADAFGTPEMYDLAGLYDDILVVVGDRISISVTQPSH